MPRFNTDKMVRAYARRFYCPAAGRYRYLNAEAMSRARALSTWKSNVRRAWPELAIRAVKARGGNGEGYVELSPKRHQLKLGSKLSVRVLVKLGNLSPDDVSVELYHGSLDARGNIRDGSVVRMVHEETSNQNGEHWFAGLMTCEKTGQHGFAVRVLPRHADLVDAHEVGLILWEKHDS